MSVLSDREIRGWMSDLFDKYPLNYPGPSRLNIDPLLEPIQPTSVDLRLDHLLIVPSEGKILDPTRGIGHEDLPRTFYEGHYLIPGQFVLGATLEWIEIPGALIGRLEGKSTLARLGLQIESAGFVDPGWEGKLTLEIKNLGGNTIVLRPGMTICQIRFEETSSRPQRLYGHPDLKSHYQRSQGPECGVVDPPQAPS